MSNSVQERFPKRERQIRLAGEEKSLMAHENLTEGPALAKSPLYTIHEETG
jgi:hypothetical protein